MSQTLTEHGCRVFSFCWWSPWNVLGLWGHFLLDFSPQAKRGSDNQQLVICWVASLSPNHLVSFFYHLLPISYIKFLWSKIFGDISASWFDTDCYSTSSGPRKLPLMTEFQHWARYLFEYEHSHEVLADGKWDNGNLWHAVTSFLPVSSAIDGWDRGLVKVKALKNPIAIRVNSYGNKKNDRCRGVLSTSKGKEELTKDSTLTSTTSQRKSGLGY